VSKVITRIFRRSAWLLWFYARRKNVQSGVAGKYLLWRTDIKCCEGRFGAADDPEHQKSRSEQKTKFQKNICGAALLCGRLSGGESGSFRYGRDQKCIGKQ
jgi:hypothetical protein